MPPELLDDCRAVALAHRMEQLRARWQPQPHWRDYPMTMAMHAYVKRHPEFDLLVHEQKLEVSRKHPVTAALRGERALSRL